MLLIPFAAHIETMEIVIQANQQILDNQINLKNKLIRRNSEKELLLHQEKSRRQSWKKS